MKNGRFQFYYDKWFVLFCFLLLLLPGILILIPSIFGVLKDIIFLAVCYWIVYFFYCFKILIPILRSKKPYLQVTPDYIQIGNYEKLFWRDIKQVDAVSSRTGIVYILWNKNISKYNLTWTQKLCLKAGAAPFSIRGDVMYQNDLKKIRKILKEHAPIFRKIGYFGKEKIEISKNKSSKIVER